MIDGNDMITMDLCGNWIILIINYNRLNYYSVATDNRFVWS